MYVVCRYILERFVKIDILIPTVNCNISENIIILGSNSGAITYTIYYYTIYLFISIIYCETWCST